MKEIKQQDEYKKSDIDAVLTRYFDLNGREITDGCVLYNPADRDPYQDVKLINGELWFGKHGTSPTDENNDWCKIDERYGTEKFWLIVSRNGE